MSLLQRLVAFALSFALMAGNAAVCEGWTSTAEARMACCTTGHPCAMHDGDSSGAGPHQRVTQSQADACCAASESHDANQSTPSLAITISKSVLGVGTPLPLDAPVLVRTDGWRTVAPCPSLHVPRHLLLSVFLV